MDFDIKLFDDYRENNRLEAKKARGGLPNSLWDTYSAMANCYGAVSYTHLASQSAAENTGSDTVANQRTMDKLKLLEDTIGKYYLESVDEQTLEKGVYDGLVKALGDPYSVYYSAEELKELQDKTEGIYYGIGAYICLLYTSRCV